MMSLYAEIINGNASAVPAEPGSTRMKSLFLGISVLILSGCASTTTDAEPDAFAAMAKEWQGAGIEEMIKVWGVPRTLQQEASTGGAGTAMWHMGTREGGTMSVNNTQTFNARQSVCEATATFDAAGVITMVETFNQNCYPNGVFEDRSGIEKFRRKF